MDVSITGARVFFTIPILGGIPITETLVNSWIVIAFIAGLCAWLTKDLKVHASSKKQIVAEYLVRAAYGLVEGNMGKRFSYYTPFIATLIAFLALSNLSSMTGLFSPTAELSTEIAFALLVFVLITYNKFKTNGPVGYLKGFLEPIPILLPFNIISEISTPVSMAFRHFGNIASGSVISALIYAALTALNHLVFGWLPGALGQLLGAIPFLTVGVPAVFSIYFDVFSGCLQAYIFTMLTMMYIQDAAGGADAPD